MALAVLILSISAIIYPIHIICFLIGFFIAYYCVPKRYKRPKGVTTILNKMQKSVTSIENISEIEIKTQIHDYVNADQLANLQKSVIEIKFEPIEIEIQNRKALTLKIVRFYQKILSSFVSLNCEIFKSYEEKDIKEIKDIIDDILEKKPIVFSLNEMFNKFTIFVEQKIKKLISTNKEILNSINTKRKHLIIRINELTHKLEKSEVGMEQIKYEYDNIEFLISHYNKYAEIYAKQIVVEVNKTFIMIFEEMNYLKIGAFNACIVPNSEDVLYNNKLKKSYNLNEVQIKAQYIYSNFKSDIKGFFGIDGTISSREQFMKKYKAFSKILLKNLTEGLQLLNEFVQDVDRIFDDFGIYSQLENNTKAVIEKILAFKSNYKILKVSKFQSDTKIVAITKDFLDIIDSILLIIKKEVSCIYLDIADNIIICNQNEYIQKRPSIAKTLDSCVTNQQRSNQNKYELHLEYFLNKLLTIFFKEWKVNEVFKSKLIRRFERKLNKRPLPNFSLIKVVDITLTDDPIVVNNIELVNEEESTITFDMQMVYQGLISVVLSTEVFLRTKLVF